MLRYIIIIGFPALVVATWMVVGVSTISSWPLAIVIGSAVLSAILIGFLAAQQIAQGTMSAFGLLSAAILGLVIPLVALLAAKASQGAPLPSPPPRPVDQKTTGQAAPLDVHTWTVIKDHLLADPVEKYGWEITLAGPEKPGKTAYASRTIRLDRAAEKATMYALNIAYMDTLDTRFVQGSHDAGAKSVSIVGAGNGKSHRLPPVCQFDVGPEDTLVYLRRESERLTVGARHQFLTVHFGTTRKRPGYVIHTERLFNPGEVQAWGPIWKSFEGRKVSGEMLIAFGGEYGHLSPTQLATDQPILLWGPLTHPQQDRAYASVIPLSLDRFDEGDVLIISVPKEFGKTLVTVNLLINERLL